MLRRLLTALFALLAMLAVRVPVLAEGAQRALLLGFDVFVTQEDTAPAAANNVARMEAALSGGEMSFDRITVSVNEVATVDAFEALALEALGDAKQEDTSYFYISTHGLWQPGEPNEEMAPAFRRRNGGKPHRRTPQDDIRSDSRHKGADSRRMPLRRDDRQGCACAVHERICRRRLQGAMLLRRRGGKLAVDKP